jgi:dihydroorotase-like cyclic amidohydrolase
VAVPDCELVVRGGTVVVPGRHEIADVGVRDGRIAQIGGAMTGQEELSAHGLLVIPGGVDAHTHLVSAALTEAVGGQWGPMWVDDFWTGSLAAFAGGITTIGNMTFAMSGESMTAAIAREMAGASAEAAADWFLHPVPAGVDDRTAGEIATLAADGHPSFKVFLSDPAAPIYIVHLSSAEALDRCRQARAAGLPVYVETRPLYLHLTRERFEEPDAAKYVGAPPLRDQSDRDALWRGLAAGDIDTVCSDHAPWTLADKLDPALDVVTARQGVADLETLMPMLFSEGVVAGRISLDRFVELTSVNAARLFGLYPRKGAIAVGSDADLALWDPNRRMTIDGTRMQSRAGYSVYDGWTVQGWPRFVIRRGQVVLADGRSLAQPGQGQCIRRTAAASQPPIVKS